MPIKKTYTCSNSSKDIRNTLEARVLKRTAIMIYFMYNVTYNI